MKYILERNSIKQILILFCLLLIPNSSIFAQGVGGEWRPAEGRIHLAVNYFNSYGGIGDGHCGYSPSDGYLNISLDGKNIIKIECDGNGGNLSVTSSYAGISHGDEQVTHANGEWSKWVQIYLPVPTDKLNKKHAIGYEGIWWRRGSTPDLAQSGGFDTDTWVQMPSLAIKSGEYTTASGKPTYSIKWERTGGSKLNGVGTIGLYDNNNNNIGTKVNTGVEGEQTFVIGADQLDITNSNSYYFKYSESLNGGTPVYESRSGSYTRKAFPQAQNLNVEFNASARTIVASWELPTAPKINVAQNEPFVLRILKKDNNTSGSEFKEISSTQISYVEGKTNYSSSYSIAEGTDALYAIEVSRNGVPIAWDEGIRLLRGETDVNTNHKKITDATVFIDRENACAIIKWKASGVVWSTGTRFVLTRLNVTSGGSEEISLTKEDLETNGTKGYTDNMIQMCNKYQYKLEVKPNEEYGGLTPAYAFVVDESGNFLNEEGAITTINKASKSVLLTDIGKISALSVSKGYFSDRVELRWNAEGGFERFIIQRKKRGEAESSYLQISNIEASPSVKQYNVEDKNCIPGTLYDYKVFGVVQCADTPLASNKLEDVGFRTPTGDLYGAVTYKDGGQAVSEVEVRLESENGSIPGKSYNFNGNGQLTVANAQLMSNCADSISLQAWINPTDLNTRQSIIKKAEMYELYIEDEQLKFKIAGTTQSSGKTKLSGRSSYIQVSAVYKKTTAGEYLVSLYIDGANVLNQTVKTTVSVNTSQVIIGDGFTGNVDEVRIWGKALSDGEVKSNYNRYLVGNETGLLAYYTFNYSTDGAFYDTSFDVTSYHENHGTVSGAVLKDAIPTNEQLGYKGITNTDGTYSIRAIPYTGSGSSYSIIPRLGIHNFSPQKEIRLFNGEAQNYTVNFTDNSSFKVSGRITYEKSAIPVQGAMFTVDGITCMNSNGTIIQSDAEGLFEISVPVGTHEVKTVMTNHKFFNSGKITNSDGTDRNYQDALNSIQLKDITTIRYIGRVVGGTVQEAYPIGHSLSTNNLADGISVTLNYPNEKYKVYEKDSTATINHFKPSNAEKANSNKVSFGERNIIIYPNQKTGEFVADVLPIKFNVLVAVPGHDKIILSGNNTEVDFSQSFIKETSVHEYTDSVEVSTGKWSHTSYSDTVSYNKSQLFIGRYTPELEIVQLDKSGKDQTFYGDEKVSFALATGEEREIVLYNSEAGSYSIDKPVFQQGSNYQFKARIFEKFVYNGTTKAGTVDKVPTQDAKFAITNNLAIDTKPVAVEADKKGECVYKFQAGDPEITSALRIMTAQAFYGDKGSSSIKWSSPLKAVVIGSKQKGTNFVTGGPNKLLTVLRDPPGSKSYAYLEKGTAFTETSTLSGGISNEGDDTAVNNLGFTLTTFTGVGVGTISTVDTDQSMTVGVHHEESMTGTSSRESTTAMTTKFQTSDDPLYVGANGDVFIGYSTNISYGAADAVSIISKEDYAKFGGSDNFKYEVYKEVTPETSDYLLIKQNAIGAGMTFGTLFAYPQTHIEGKLIPDLETMRNNFLEPNTRTESEFQTEANTKKAAVYVSKLGKEDPNFGKSNNDIAFKDVTSRKNLYDGQSYKIYFPENAKVKNDTILYLNQSIGNWYKQLAANEEAKTKAKLLQNYSLQAAASIEYSESYTEVKAEESSFSTILGMSLENSFGTDAMGLGLEFTINESFTTEVTNTSSSSDEKTQTKGFVLAEEGSDYITLDVCREAGSKPSDETGKEDTYYSSFIFKTRGGATSCPYEDAYVTKYYQPGTQLIDQATMRIEVPEISVEKDFIENVPSGKSAYFTLYLRNNSEIQEDGWYNLKIIDGSNPNGAQLLMDGAAIGNGRAILVPAGETLAKTLEVKKGAVMNYDLLQLTLESQCQCEIADTVSFSVHFTPSCTDVNIKKPSNNWTYNTKLKTELISGIDKNYMDVILDGFDVNYDNFNSIRLQYKPTSGSDEDWSTLISYFSDSKLYDAAIAKGINAKMILAEDAGAIKYKWFLNDMPDQRYDLRAVSVCMINNTEVENISETRSGIKDMYCPRLFGSAQPANGILTINDEVRLNFNETISDGLLTVNNFQVKGVRNGTKTNHSTSVRLDGTSDYFESQFNRNWNGKDITIEMWVLEDKAQNATFFSQGNQNQSLEFGITEDRKLKVKVGSTEITSVNAVPYDQGTWAHVAMTIDKNGIVSAYYNYVELISNVQTEAYTGEGNFIFGRSIATKSNYFAGKMHNARVWDKVLTSGRLQTNSLNLLSGTDNNLLAYYPMNEARGTVLEDKSRGANLEMKGGEWDLPAGRAAKFDGNQYLKITTGSAVITGTMDYTLEFWFKAESGQPNATLVSNGRGDGLDMGGSANKFSLGFEDGILTFHNNEVKATAQGDYLDNNWHHFALAVNRTTGRAQMIVDGNLNSYFDAQDLGGINAAKTYLGARVWTEEADITTPKEDNFFKGTIDDFRFWNLYKSESIISEGNNERLDGKEKGLLAYYPFEYYKEWQGTTELQFTLADQKVQSDPTQKIPDGVVKGEGNLETSDIAPVKDKGPVSDLSYDFVVNNDALILNLNEPWEKVEKTIVTFTVDGVRDVNGNEVVSPITWSTYIDRNQLKWSENELTVEKKVNEPLTFKLQAQNLGGSVQHFTIENMPSWMDVTPSEGTVNPKSNLNITFTVDEGLNVGSYDEVVYMRNDNNVSEALPINIKVNGEKPDWSVNPKNFKYNMNVYGKLRINNIFSIDKEDMLVAFSNGQCVGVVNNQYLKVNDMWYAFLTVYNNNTKTDNLEFRIWDASTGKIYMATTTETVTFQSDKIWGSAANPLTFDAKEMTVQNVAVGEGWNWVSFNVDTDMLKNVENTLKNNQWTSGDFVKDETNGKFVSYLPRTSQWIGTMTAGGFDNKHMYLIKSSKLQTVSVTGIPIKAKEDLTLSVGKGWNYIGYLPNVNLTLKEALAGYNAQEGDIIKGQNEFSMYGNNNLGWLGNLAYMKSGQGYMLYRGGEATNLVYPSTSSSAVAKNTRASVGETSYANKQYAQNMSLIATVGGTAQIGDRILAYAGNELRGVGEAISNPANDSILYFISINGEEKESLSFVLERKGKTIAQTNAVFDYSSNTVKGNIQRPYVLNFMTDNSENIYPNPFSRELNIVMSVKPQASVEISINDISGRIVRRCDIQQTTDGYIHITLNDLDGFAPGIYMVNVKVDGENNVYKVEKK